MPEPKTVFVAYGPGGRFCGYIAAVDIAAAGYHAMRRTWTAGPVMRIVPAGSAALLDRNMSAGMRAILTAGLAGEEV